MRAAAARLKGDLQQGKDIETVQVFVLKLPDAAVHQFHVTEGEVKCTYFLFCSKLKEAARAPGLPPVCVLSV